jgi:hypothetical protein
MSIPNRVESSAGGFRTRTGAARPPEATGPTERLNLGPKPKLDARTRGRRTRRTVDLSPATHRALDIWQREAADRLGLARVTGQEVFIALIDRLLSDPQLSSQVIGRIRARR